MTKEYAKVLLTDQSRKLREEDARILNELAKVSDALQTCDYILGELGKAEGNKSREDQLCDFLVDFVKEGKLDGVSQETKLSWTKLRRY